MIDAAKSGWFSRRVLFALIALIGFARTPASADPVPPDQAISFVTNVGNRLVGMVNQGSDPGAQAQQLEGVLDQDVDIDGVAKFCLGRFWRTASPAQQQEFVDLFHAVLLRSFGTDMGGYQGVTFKVGQVLPRNDGGVAVQTVLTRPNNAPNNMQWVVINQGGALKINDLIVEGTSLKLTKREEYASYLQNNGNNLDVLLAAMKAQAQSQQ